MPRRLLTAAVWAAVSFATPQVNLAATVHKSPQPAVAVASHATPKAAAVQHDKVIEDRESALLKSVDVVAKDWLKRADIAHSYVGLEIMDVRSGRTLFDYNAHKRFVTASTAKIIANACLYETLGPAFTYKTKLVGLGSIRNGRLDGSLCLVPSQDPSLEDKDLLELIAQIQPRLHSVGGHVISQVETAGGDKCQTEWLVQDWGQDWMPVSSDFVLNRNIAPKDLGRGYPLNVSAAKDQASALERSLLLSEWGAAWVIFNRNNTVTFYRPEGVITGGIMVGNPGEYNTAALASMLKARGIKVENGDVISLAPMQLAEHTSKPLSDLIRYTLKESDNLYCQQFLRTLGALPFSGKETPKGELEDRGLVRISAWLQKIGVPSGEAVLWDACGLSRKNAVTPHALNTVLRHMSLSEPDSGFINLMVHEGEGPLKTFHYKTGAMDTVRGLTGVVKTAAGDNIAMTAIVNDHTPSVRELKPTLHALVSKLESLGSVNLKPAAPPRPACKAATRKHANGGRLLH